MYELVRLGEKTYFIDCPSRIGVYMESKNEVCIVDSGNSPDVGKIILRICRENNWKINCIINTHAHADHVGGNSVIQKQTNCVILSNERENCLINQPTLNNTCTFGSLPPKELQNRFMLADKSLSLQISSNNIPKGIKYKAFPGHSFDQIAVICDDGTCFTGDILCGTETINKYHIFYVQNAEKYVESANEIKKLNANVYCAAHYAPLNSASKIAELADLNIEKLNEIIKKIQTICKNGKCFEQIFKELLDGYGLSLSFNQYAIAGSTIKGFLSMLHDKGNLDVEFTENYLLWKSRI